MMDIFLFIPLLHIWEILKKKKKKRHIYIQDLGRLSGQDRKIISMV